MLSGLTNMMPNVLRFLLFSISPMLSTVLLTMSATQPSNKIALTFDEIPYMKPMGFWRPREISNRILRTLEEEEITATGFVVQEKVEDDTSTYVILEDWLSHGHTLGNQTWGDVDYNVIGFDDFMEHAVDGQKYLKRLSRKFDFNYRFLRFPQLHEGNEPRKKKRLRKALDRANYRVAHVSVKTSGYAFNPACAEHALDTDTIDRLRGMYLDHVLRSLEYSERQSQKVFGRNISHIMQLHIGLATANFLPDLVEALRSRGYEFISLSEALADPAYRTEEEYVGPLGLTFIDRVAVTRGMEFDETAGILDRADVERALR